MNKQSKTDKVFLIITIIVAILAVVLMIMSFSNAASFSDQLEKARENGMIVNNRKQIENAIATYTRNGILFAVLLVLFLFNSIMQMTSKMTITDFGVSGTFMGFTIFHKKVSLAFSEIR
ncbi:MAG: hypothetical protein IJ676_00695 [Clostridia bacterium]|nr:hypothetical protein [Clostridia bacterium]MBR1867224.1 hypothetical protein [Clostridia bacterium]